MSNQDQRVVFQGRDSYRVGKVAKLVEQLKPGEVLLVYFPDEKSATNLKQQVRQAFSRRGTCETKDPSVSTQPGD